jgi:hypothetical protein
VFTARYGLSPYIKQIRFVFKGLNIGHISENRTQHSRFKFPKSRYFTHVHSHILLGQMSLCQAREVICSRVLRETCPSSRV